MSIDHDLLVLLTKIAACLHALGILSAFQAVLNARTPQGAIAWAMALIAFPYVSLPLFWIFGRDRFNGYTIDRQVEDSKLSHIRKEVAYARVPAGTLDLDPTVAEVFEDLAEMGFSRGNRIQLCINGQETFDAIFREIEKAKDYLLIQFFIIKNDEIGRALKTKVIEATKRGVKVSFLYDEIGSHALPKAYVKELKDNGVDVLPFKTTKGTKNRFQVNFRNHRKIVVVDGKVAFIGGHNVGDEYLGKGKLGFWRDTHVRIEGPAALQAQVSFMEDWHWSSGAIPDFKWEPGPINNENKSILILPSGPADKLDTCTLFFLQAINAAKKRLWITSPYFVPDSQIISALQLAVMRGVDVKVILPSIADHYFVYFASFAFLKETVPQGVKLFRYQNGFIHEKVLLVDDNLAGVGTANFDNRSFRLNFEVTALIADKGFAREVEKMLLADLAQSKPVTMSEIDDSSYWFKLAVRVSRLMSPVL